MLSAPPAISQTANPGNDPQDPSSTNQHGLSTNTDLASDGRPDERLIREPSHLDPPDDVSVDSSATSRGRRSDLRRMSTGHESPDSSPGSRVEAYERANAIPRRHSDGMVFQVLPSTGNSGTSVLDMPNGERDTLQTAPLLTFCRGTDTHPVPPAARVALLDELGQ